MVWLGAAACAGGSSSAAKQSTEAPAAVAPQREAARDHDLRIMVAQVAAAEACHQLRDRFHGLDTDGRTTGTLWIEQCSASSDGERVSLRGAARGWRWIAKEKEKLGADFEVSQYLRFALEGELAGEVDVAYAPRPRIFTAWLTTERPQVGFRVLGDVEVDGEGLWGELVGAGAAATGSSPDARGRETADRTGGAKIRDKLRQGLTVTVSMCSGDLDVGFGHLPVGEMVTPPEDRPGEATEKGRIYPEGLILSGPEKVVPGTKLRIEPDGGGLWAGLVCHRDALKLADAFLAGRELPRIEPVLAAEVSEPRTLEVTDPRCDEAAIAFRPLDGADEPTSFRYGLDRPGPEHEPFIDCPAEK